MSGLAAVLRKEAKHLLRDRALLGFALTIPVFEMLIFGVIDTNVKRVPTAVLDLSLTAESRDLVAGFVHTGTFEVVSHVGSRAALRGEIVAGRASAGIEIPPDFARRRLAGEPGDVLVLVDGSDAALSAQALAAANGLALSRSLEALARDRGALELAVRPFPRVLFNPDSRSANLLLPGLIAILLTFSGTILAAFSIVKERERGTLEQLLVTPVSPAAVVLGKLLPYLGVGLAQLAAILALMTGVFRVPIHGSALLLVVLAVVYLFSLLAAGLLVSSRFPATHFIAIARGIVIRGAGFSDLRAHVAALVVLSALLLLASTRAFRKTVG